MESCKLLPEQLLTINNSYQGQGKNPFPYDTVIIHDSHRIEFAITLHSLLQVLYSFIIVLSIINVPGTVNNDAMTMVGKRDGPKINRDDAMVIPLVTFNEASLPDRKVVKKKMNSILQITMETQFGDQQDGSVDKNIC